MKTRSLFCLIAVLAVSACKKADDAVVDNGPAGRPPAGPGSSAEVKSMEDEARKAIAAKDYDTAAADMFKLTKQPTLSQSEADNLRSLNESLLKAAQTDPKAMEVYRNMSAAQKGR